MRTAEKQNRKGEGRCSHADVYTLQASIFIIINIEVGLSFAESFIWWLNINYLSFVICTIHATDYECRASEISWGAI